jgi:hypothetical protein
MSVADEPARHQYFRIQSSRLNTSSLTSTAGSATKQQPGVPTPGVLLVGLERAMERRRCSY